jgi:hypothetical protein
MKELMPGQTVCNERNEKGKLCAGPLKRRPDPTYRSKQELEGTDVVHRCGRCYTLYQGPPLGYLRDTRMKEYVMSVMPDITPPEPKPAQEQVKKETPGSTTE